MVVWLYALNPNQAFPGPQKEKQEKLCLAKPGLRIANVNQKPRLSLSLNNFRTDTKTYQRMYRSNKVGI